MVYKDLHHIDLEKVRTAIEIIKWRHGPTKRYSGETFYLYPVVVTKIELKYDQSETTLLTAQIVDAVTHLESNKKTFYKARLSDNENIFKLLEVKNRRACYIKIADRLHDMRTIQGKPYESQCSTAEETLRFFVPLAKKLGLKNAVQELKERSLTVLD